MTPHGTEYRETAVSDPSGDESGAPAIEITPDMIRAGAYPLFIDDELNVSSSLAELWAEQVLVCALAMYFDKTCEEPATIAARALHAHRERGRRAV